MKFIECINETTFMNEDRKIIEFKYYGAKKKTELNEHGFVWDSKYPCALQKNNHQIRHPIFNIWDGMRKRTTSKIHQSRMPNYKETYVCKEWRLYSTFAQWVMEQQIWLGRQLDKDLLRPGNKEYGPKYCRFVPSQINNLFVDSGTIRGNFPMGVYKHENSYIGVCKLNHNKEVLRKTFSHNLINNMSDKELISMAHAYWQQVKMQVILGAIKKHLIPEYDQDIINALLNRFEILKSDVEAGRETIKL